MSSTELPTQSVLAALKRPERLDVLRADPTASEFPSARVALEGGLTVVEGRIASVGRYADGSGSVEFYVGGGACYGSVWPKWAFEFAKDALLRNKRVRVIANGDPYGDNLIHVDLRAR